MKRVLLDNFDILSEAPNGIKTLRELILQLAVMGKLVSQDAGDESAGVLLERIKSEKEKLIKEGKIRKQKSLPEITDDERPYELPKGWEWVRLNEIFLFIDYRGKTPSKTSSGIKLITAKNIRMGYINKHPEEYVSEDTYVKWMTRGIPRPGDILFTTEAPLANVARVEIAEKFALAQRAINFQPYLDFNTSFFLYSLISKPIQTLIHARATGMTAKGIKADRLKLITIPFPPLNEQKRIVAQVDRLMALCDELEKKKEKRERKRVSLNNALLEKLLSSREADEFNEHWKRITENFDILYNTPDNVVKLKQSILQLAVMGKLVPRDPDDEPAVVLLDRIKKEKDRLIEEGKIKKTKPLPPISDAEKPYPLPKGWEWVRLGNLGFTQTGTTPSKDNSEYFGDHIPFIKPADIFVNHIRYDNEGLSKEGIEKGRLIKKNSIMMVCIGGSIGKVNYTGIDCSCNQQINTLTPYITTTTSHEILNYFMRSTYFQKEVLLRAPQTTFPILSKGKWELIPLPLPPLEEQKRIVAKVERLMGFCDDLEKKLRDGERKRDTLFHAVVNQLHTNTGNRQRDLP